MKNCAINLCMFIGFTTGLIIADNPDLNQIPQQTETATQSYSKEDMLNVLKQDHGLVIKSIENILNDKINPEQATQGVNELSELLKNHAEFRTAFVEKINKSNPEIIGQIVFNETRSDAYEKSPIAKEALKGIELKIAHDAAFRKQLVMNHLGNLVDCLKTLNPAIIAKVTLDLIKDEKSESWQPFLKDFNDLDEHQRLTIINGLSKKNLALLDTLIAEQLNTHNGIFQFKKSTDTIIAKINSDTYDAQGIIDASEQALLARGHGPLFNQAVVSQYGSYFPPRMTFNTRDAFMVTVGSIGTVIGIVLYKYKG